MTPVAIAFGANLGEREQNITLGLEELGGMVKWRACSALYETEPMYNEDQPMFLNGVAYGETEAGPLQLVAELKRVESLVGLRSLERNGPRYLDLDLIVYGNAKLDLGGVYPLLAPHPRLGERRFVLDPLFEAWPDLKLPWVDLESLRHSSIVSRQYMIRKANAPIRIQGA